MNIRTPLRRGSLAIPLALAILVGALLVPGPGPYAVSFSDNNSNRLGCTVSAAIGADREHVLQLPGDLPVHLRLRLHGCPDHS